MFPILYSFRRCPYAIRARLAILSANIRVELREVVLKNKPLELLQASYKATVPVLVLPDGEVIDESRDIMLWALHNKDPQGWLDCSLKQANELIDGNDFEFKPLLDAYKYADRYPEPAELYRQQAEVFLQRLEGRLQHQPYLLGGQVSYADMAIFPFIRQFAHVDNNWFQQTEYHHLQHWLTNFLEADSFEQIMKKQGAWLNGDAAIYFP